MCIRDRCTYFSTTILHKYSDTQTNKVHTYMQIDVTESITVIHYWSPVVSLATTHWFVTSLAQVDRNIDLLSCILWLQLLNIFITAHDVTTTVQKVTVIKFHIRYHPLPYLNTIYRPIYLISNYFWKHNIIQIRRNRLLKKKIWRHCVSLDISYCVFWRQNLRSN